MGQHPEFMLDGDVVAPRTKAERYRIYRVKDGGAPELVATCRTPGSVGVTLCTLGAEDEFLNYCVGVLDGMDHQNEQGDWVGRWLILPWQEKEHDSEESGSGNEAVPGGESKPSAGSDRPRRRSKST